MKLERIGLRIEKDLKNELSILAEKENRSLSNYIQSVLKNHIFLKGKKFDNLQS